MDNILKLLLNRPRTIITLLIVLVFAGLASYIGLPKEGDPDIPIPIFHIAIPFHGISPEDADKLLVGPMEKELNSIEGLKKITSSATQGYASIILEFDVNFDKEKAGIKVREKVDKAKAKLPNGADEPTVSEFNTALSPVINVTISGSVPERTLKKYADLMQDTLEGIDTVLEANVQGVREEVLEVVIDTLRLESYKITTDQLIGAVQRNNQLVSAGALQGESGNFSIKLPGLFKTNKDVLNLPIKSDGNVVVTLKDVAEVRRTFKDATGFARVNGQPAVSISVVKRLGTNLIATNEAVRVAVTELTSDWPETIKVGYILDSSVFIFEVMNSLESSIITAIILVMIVVMAVMSIRSSFLVGISIPASFLMGFVVISFMGMTLNMMVMFGLVLTVGILVDGAIVIVEYADRKMTEGLSKKAAYTLSAQRMFWPIFSSTATTLAAFLPMLLWPGVTGKFMSYLPITVVVVLSVALVTAMIFMPSLGTIFGKPSADDDPEQAKMLSGGSHVDYSEIRGLAGVYLRFLNGIIHHPAKVIVTSLLIMFLVFTGFKYNNAGVEFFVETEPDMATIYISARGNLSPLEKLEIAKKVEDITLGVTGIKSSFMSVNGGGISSGAAQTGGPADEIANITIELKEFSKRRKGKVILAEILSKTEAFPGIRIEVRGKEQGPPTGKAVSIEIVGKQYENVNEATKILREFVSTVSGLKDIEDTRPLPGIEWVLNVDRVKASRFGSDVLAVGNMVQLVTNGVTIGNYRPADADDEVDIVLRFPENERSLDRLDLLQVQTPYGVVPVRNFLTRSPQQVVSTINRQDGKIIMKLQAAVLDGVLADDKVTEIKSWIEDKTWPAGVTVQFGGADKEQAEAGEFLGKAMVASLFIMFIILLTQFNSFYQTIITLSTVVMSVFGVLLGIWVTGQTFSIIMTGTGVVALAGIVVNNSIVLIDTYNHMLSLGSEKIDAALRAAAQRLRPVLLTTITTIAGLLPMALQININFIERQISFGGITSVWWVQLATAIIFGLGFSTVLTLVLTPILLALPSIYKNKWDAFRANRNNRKTIKIEGSLTKPAE